MLNNILNHRYPSLKLAVSRILQWWPEHEGYLKGGFANFNEQELILLERIAEKVLLIAGDTINRHVENYKWMCDIFFREEVFFRRNGRYRLTRFEQAQAEVYSKHEFMLRYMDGLLYSQVLWTNHIRSTICFVEEFLEPIREPFNYLEIGPGHGLFTAFAAGHPYCETITGWDVSPTSLEQTAVSLQKMGVDRPVQLDCRDIFALLQMEGCYDVLVISEVLEHLEDPFKALKAVVSVMRPGGKIFVNFPINSPAPDHIYLLQQPEDVIAMVQSAGLKVKVHAEFPAAGYDLPTAMKQRQTVSCVVIAERLE